MTDLAAFFSPAALAALDEYVRERIEERLAELPDGKPWLNVREAAVYVGVHPRTIERRIESGKLRVTGFGRRRIVRRDDLDAMLEGRK